MLVALGVGVISATFIGKLPPALPQIRETFGLSMTGAGWLTAMFNALALVGAIACGVLADRIGGWRACVGGLLLLALGTVLGAVAGSATMLGLSRFIEGIGFLLAVVAAPVLISGSTAVADRRLALGIWGAYMPLGTTLTMLLAPLTGVWATTWFGMASNEAWRVLWWLELGFIALGLVGLWHWREAYGITSALPRARAAIIAPLLRLGPWVLGIAFGCYTFQFYAIMVWLPTYLIEIKYLAPASAALAAAAMVAVNIPGNLFGAWCQHRGLARGTQMMLGASGMALGAWLAFDPLAWGISDALRFAACLWFSFIGGLVPSSVLSGSQTHARAPSEIATIQGVMVQVGNLGQFIAPPLVALVVGTRANWGQIVVLLVGAAAVCGALGWVTGWLERRAG